MKRRKIKKTKTGVNTVAERNELLNDGKTVKTVVCRTKKISDSQQVKDWEDLSAWGNRK
ncbi:hypothetical protein [Enterobacter roggenkampii]|uniref:hypothetical protein n=1 Tax=Enterobacter roggenkampii TaxID=1812935 RepID=UPI0012FFADF6|nr:hypothetical protein [Enterobacter roggenkampii]QWZ75445.1 hypothetical protein I6L60_22700 [Enterobacter roggenkampii]